MTGSDCSTPLIRWLIGTYGQQQADVERALKGSERTASRLARVCLLGQLSPLGRFVLVAAGATQRRRAPRQSNEACRRPMGSSDGADAVAVAVNSRKPRVGRQLCCAAASQNEMRAPVAGQGCQRKTF
jgi:hypothetical protein